MQFTLATHSHIRIIPEKKHSFIIAMSGQQQAVERLTHLETRLLLCILEEAGEPASLLTCIQCDEESWANRKTHPSIWKKKVKSTQDYLEKIALDDHRQFKREKQTLYDAIFRLRKKIAKLGLTIRFLNNQYTLEFLAPVQGGDNQLEDQ
jgi:hypothetical protein